jgi:hypothetical protein
LIRDPNGTPLGSTKEAFWFFVPKFETLRADGSKVVATTMNPAL